ncbi:MAG: endonuclease III [Chloroflexi bacterium]|nr:endonuclease III [Chloroflexota bacterium]
MIDEANPLTPKYNIIAQALAHEYGYPTWRQHYPPVDEMVDCILSQNTNDNNRDKAFAALKERFATWEEVRDADPQLVVEAIRPAGLANQKGPRIQGALRHVTDQVGEISLDHLNDMPVDEAKTWLTSINGIGPKTAAIILLFALNKPALPVDTHVHRVTKRLGLIGPKTSAEKAHDELEALVPQDDFYPFHLQIIWHGRQVCNARKPKCGACVLRPHCNYFDSLPPEEQAEKLAT